MAQKPLLQTLQKKLKRFYKDIKHRNCFKTKPVKKALPTYFLISILILAGCAQKTEQKDLGPGKTQETKAPQTKAISHPTLVFCYPDSNFIRDFQEKYGMTAWYHYRDSLGSKFFRHKAFCSEEKIPAYSTDQRFIRFNLSGQEIIFDNRLFLEGAGVLMFDGIRPPKILDKEKFNTESLALSQKPALKQVEKQPHTNLPAPKIEEIAATKTHLAIRENTDSVKLLIPLDADGIDPIALRRIIKSRPLPANTLEDIARLNTKTLLSVVFENDIFSNTDRYFTNGSQIHLYSPVFATIASAQIFLPYNKYAVHTYGLGVVQNIYTPSTTKLGGIQYGDRPYSGVLYASFSRNSTDLKRRQSLISEVNAGVIGPASEGEFVQSLVHNVVPTNDEPLGWEYQIQNDIVLNYDLWFEKQWFLQGKFSANTILGAQAGTLYDKAWFGASAYYSYIQNGFQSSNDLLSRIQKNAAFNWRLFVDLRSSLNIYDATLQGGMFNKSSVYTISATETEKVVFKGQFGGGFTYKWLGFRATQNILSPEFVGGKFHFWGSFHLLFFLN